MSQRESLQQESALRPSKRKFVVHENNQGSHQHSDRDSPDKRFDANSELTDTCFEKPNFDNLPSLRSNTQNSQGPLSGRPLSSRVGLTAQKLEQL